MNRDDLIKMYDFTGKTFAVTGGGGVLAGGVVIAALDAEYAAMFVSGRYAFIEE